MTPEWIGIASMALGLVMFGLGWVSRGAGRSEKPQEPREGYSASVLAPYKIVMEPRVLGKQENGCPRCAAREKQEKVDAFVAAALKSYGKAGRSAQDWTAFWNSPTTTPRQDNRN